MILVLRSTNHLRYVVHVTRAGKSARCGRPAATCSRWSVGRLLASLKRALDGATGRPGAARDAAPDILEPGADRFALPVVLAGVLAGKRILQSETQPLEPGTEFVPPVFERVTGSTVRVGDGVRLRFFCV